MVLRSAPSYGFGASKRPQSQGGKAYVPGPGTYPVKSIIGTETQGKTLAGRYEQARTSNMMAPGPGTYEPNAKPALTASPSWKMGSSKRDDSDKLKMRTSNFPPPDSYNPNMTSIKERNASWSFGSGQRAKLASVGLTTPAPGTYNVPNRAIEGPKYPMGSKIEANSAFGVEQRKTRGNPGPGNYNPDFSKSVKNPGAFSMKSRPQTKAEDRAPGPGAYSSANANKKGPAFGFGSASQREKVPEKGIPGPGNYHIPCSIGDMPGYTGARPKTFGYI